MNERIRRSRTLTADKAVLIAVLIFAWVGSVRIWGQNADRPTSSQTTSDGSAVARGKYIVESLAMCSQCHTPMDNNGRPDKRKHLAGAPLWLQPAKPMGDWPLQAPRIAGTPPPGSDEEMVTLLTTGIWRDGKRLRPPMPEFRMSRQDAQAVVTYLKSVNPTPAP